MTWPAGACAGEPIQQTMDGAVSGCLRVGAVGAGAYTVSLQQILPSYGGVATSGDQPTKRQNDPSLKLSVSPTAGPPGTRVNLTGVFSAPPAERAAHASLCWDGCPGGLEYGGVPLTWSSASTFHTSIVVPAAPWVKTDPAKVAMLASGRYSIGVQCVQETKGCGGVGAQALASFDLRVRPGGGATWCASSANCAQLDANPAAALPGATIAVSGFAPLMSVIGPDRPFAYQWQVFAGASSGPPVSFGAANDKGAVAAYFGKAAVTVRPAPTFAGLGQLGVERELASGPLAITPEAGSQATLAWCGGNSIVISDGGKTTTIPIAAAASVLRRSQIQTWAGWSPTCGSAAVLPGGSGTSPAVAAAFSVEPRDQNMMVADIELVTRDEGRTWTPIPTPAGAKPFSFGGFRYQDGALAALFGSDQGVSPLVESSADGGASWRRSALECPQTGPCVSFGAYQIGDCAKGIGGQPVLYSTDGGAHWRQPAGAEQVGTCMPAHLVATQGDGELLVDPGSPYLVRRSTDGGASWTDIAVPALPGQQLGDELGLGQYSVTPLPAGGLLAVAQPNTWLLLRPGADSWCAAESSPPSAPASFASLTIAGGQLWWLTTDNSGNASVHSIDIGALRCAAP